MKYEVCHVMIVMSPVISLYVIISIITYRLTPGYSGLRWWRTDILICTVQCSVFMFLGLSLVSRVHLEGVGGVGGCEGQLLTFHFFRFNFQTLFYLPCAAACFLKVDDCHHLT